MEKFTGYSTEEWKQFYSTDTQPISEGELNKLKAFTDKISVEDARDVYVPFVHLLRIAADDYRKWEENKADFLQEKPKRIPFIIGVSGSVAVGKSTTARLLKYLFDNFLPDWKTELITTDGFLFPNNVLHDKGIEERKGFPESYDMESLIAFLMEIKSGEKEVKAPVYSHQIYDIVPNRFDVIKNPDVLIVEGINTLQVPESQNLYISDFTDFSIYIDADEDLIENWYIDRFKQLTQTAFKDPTNYYYKYAKEKPQVAEKMARDVWNSVNLPNLRLNILPTRDRANAIIHKTKHHKIDRIYLRKY